MNFAFFDQQPIGRVVGHRTPPPVGVPPTPESRAAFDTWARRRTRVPKGVIRYTDHDEMARDRERWQTDAIVDSLRKLG